MSHNAGEITHVEQIARLVTVMADRSKLKYAQIRELMSDKLKWNYDIDRFNRKFRGKETSENPHYDLEELLALIHVLTNEVSPEQRCTVHEAFQLFSLARISLADFKTLKEFFSEQDYRAAWKPYAHSEIGVDDLRKDRDFLKPIYPQVFIGRDNDLAALHYRLGVDNDAGRDALTVIRGWPGVGKTTLINRLVYDEQGRLDALYPDGILWTSLGPQGDVLQALRNWARQIGAVHIEVLQNLEDVVAQMRLALQNRRVLLVIDDVWDETQGGYFKRLGSDQTTLLFATRFTDLAYRLAEVPRNVYILPVLTPEQSFEVLRAFAPYAMQLYSSELADLVLTLEGLPLALRVAGRLIEDECFIGFDAKPLIDALQTDFRGFQDLAPSDRFDEKVGQTPTIGLLFKLSVQTLARSEQRTFTCMGAFAPKPATFDLDSMTNICALNTPEYTMRVLVGRGLVEPMGYGRFQMHYTLSLYAKHLLNTKMAELMS